MCQTVYVPDEGMEIRTPRQFAAWLGIKIEELQTVDLQPMPKMEDGDWRDSCLCPFDIRANLDASKIWSRRELSGDPMVILAMKAAVIALRRERG